MKKYQSLLKKKKKLEEQIVKLCNRFTDSTGLIIENIYMNPDINILNEPDKVTKIFSNYNAEVNCRL